MNKKIFLLCVTSFIASNVNSASINVLNHSFEAANLSSGAFNTSVPDWNNTGVTGSFNGTGFFNFIPDGTHTAYSQQAGEISQVLSETLTAGTLYELKVEVGHANNIAFGGYSIELWAGSTLLAFDNSSLGDPGIGNWQTSTIQYSALSGDSALGQALTIKLSNLGGGEANFDNVRLNAVSSVPVPAAAWLFGSGLLGLAGIARRKG